MAAAADGVRRVLIEDVGRVTICACPLPPSPRLSEVTVQARYSLISSGTELSYYHGTNQKLVDGVRGYPVTPGYSMVGRVIAVGERVADLVPGDTVFAAAPHASAQNVERSACVRIPDERCVRYTVANIAAVAATASSAMQAVNAVGPVAVFGLGLVGNICAQTLCHEFDTTGYSWLDNRVRALARCGVRARSAAELTGRSRFGTIVEAAGTSPSVAAALAAVAPGGCVVLLGSPREVVEIDLYRSIHESGVTLIGAHSSKRSLFDARTANAGSLGQSLADAVALIECEAISVDPLISRTIGFTDVSDAYALLSEHPDQVTAIVLDWDRRGG